MRRPPRAFLIVWAIWLLGALAFSILYHPRQGSSADFRSFYAAGYLALHHPSALYSPAAQQAVQDQIDANAQGVLPFAHLGYEALLYAPFTAIPYRNAYSLSMVVNMLLLLAAFLAVPEVFSRLAPLWQPRAGLQMFFFLPLFFALIQGQDSLLLLFICCCTLRYLERDQPVRAGAVLALALFKFQIALPLLLLVASRRGWRVAAGFLPVGGLLVAGSVLLTGVRPIADLGVILGASTLAHDAGSASQAMLAIYPAAMPNLMGLAFTLCGSPFLSLAVTVLSSAATLAFGLWCMHRETGEPEAFGIAILCTVLVSYHLYLHDATLLLIPLAIWSRRTVAALLLLAPIPLLLLGGSRFYLLAPVILGLLVEASRGEVAPIKITDNAPMRA